MKNCDVGISKNLLQRCDRFLESIATMDLQFMSAEARFYEAQAKFKSVVELVQLAEGSGLIAADLFMRDKTGRNHWVGGASEIVQEPDGAVSLVRQADRVHMAFNYKAHCRVPVRTLRNAALESLKTAQAGPAIIFP